MNAPIKTPVPTFAEAFVQLQAEIRPAIKDATNPAFRSKYADLGAVWEAVKEPLKGHGFAIIQMPQFEGDTMYLETIILHVSGEKMAGRYPIKPTKQDPQGYGSAITYARRYSVCAMLGVIADDDDDGNAASTKPTAAAPKPAAPSAPPVTPLPQDEDTVSGFRNWLDQNKELITAAERLPDLYMWLDDNGGSWTKPHTSSNLDKTKRKMPQGFEEIKAHYQAKLAELNNKKG